MLLCGEVNGSIEIRAIYCSIEIPTSSLDQRFLAVPEMTATVSPIHPNATLFRNGRRVNNEIYKNKPNIKHIESRSSTTFARVLFSRSLKA